MRNVYIEIFIPVCPESVFFVKRNGIYLCADVYLFCAESLRPLFKLFYKLGAEMLTAVFL